MPNERNMVVSEKFSDRAEKDLTTASSSTDVPKTGFTEWSWIISTTYDMVAGNAYTVIFS